MEITIKTNDGPFVLEGIVTRTPGLEPILITQQPGKL